MMNARDAAIWWIERYAFHPVPVGWKEKGATLKGWPDLRLTIDTVDQYFNGEPQNISILMGSPKNLADVDVDCDEARWAAMEYLPVTGLNWGRPSNPNSHHLYYTDPAAASVKYLDPAADAANACMIELRCLTKDGKPGFPVIVPPSTHPSGEPYEFTGSAGFPATVAGPKLGALVQLIAAASMLGRHAREGARHEIFIALAGAFARAKWELEDAQRFLRAVYRVIWHSAADIRQASNDVDSTYQRYDDGGETTGLTKLGTLIDERVFKKLKEWLSLQSEDEWAHQQAPAKKKPRVLPGAITDAELRKMIFPGSEPLVEQWVYGPGLGLITGASKDGKTVLAVQIAQSCANKLHFLDYYATRQANCLIVEWDDQQGGGSLKDFVKKTRAARDSQPISYSIRAEIDDLDFNLTDPEFVPWLRDLIKKHQARLVVLDSYTALRGYHSGGRDVVKVEAGEMLLLQKLAIELNCCILLIHHASKSSAHLDRHSRSAGSFAIQAVSEFQIVVERFRELSEEDPMRLVSVRGRHLRGLQMALKFREDTLDFDWVMDGPAAEEFPRLRHLLRAFRGKSFTVPEITKEIGWAKTQAYALMSRLGSSGLVLKDGTAWSWSPAWIKTLEQI